MHTIFQYYASVKLKPLIIHHVVSVLFGLGLNKSARYRLIIVITTHMINDCGSILVKDNGFYCSNCVEYVSQCIAMTVYLLVIYLIYHALNNAGESMRSSF